MRKLREFALPRNVTPRIPPLLSKTIAKRKKTRLLSQFAMQLLNGSIRSMRILKQLAGSNPPFHKSPTQYSLSVVHLKMTTNTKEYGGQRCGEPNFLAPLGAECL